MRTYLCSQFGLDHLRLHDVDPVRPQAGEVLVGVRAISLNFRDLLVVRGEYNPKLRLPFVPVSDGAGEVLAVGAGVTRVRPGDRVIGSFVADWIDGPFRAAYTKSTLGTPGPGLAAEQVALPEQAVVPIPAELSWADAAALPIAALTAWSALVTEGGLTAEGVLPAGAHPTARARPTQADRAADRGAPEDPPFVLTLGTGGVSIFTLQLATALGARVIVTSGSDDKLARARQLGAFATVNYLQRADWDAAVLELTGRQGAHVTVETGGAGTLGRSLRATRAGGLIAVLGALTGLKAEIDSSLILMKRLRLAGIFVDSRAALENLIAFVLARGLRPVMSHRFGFDELPAALRVMQHREHFGKIVLEL